MKVGLYFGSYNPIHIGHQIIANAMVEHTSLDEVWFVVSPQNPFKQNQVLLEDYLRVELVQKAIEGNPHLKVCDIEMQLPKPSYTIVTLTRLRELYPHIEFSLVLGSDNMDDFMRWKQADEILDNFHIYVYPRPNHLDSPVLQHHSVTLVKDLPHLEISSTYIREQISQGKSVQYLLSQPVYEIISNRKLYSGNF